MPCVSFIDTDSGFGVGEWRLYLGGDHGTSKVPGGNRTDPW